MSFTAASQPLSADTDHAKRSSAEAFAYTICVAKTRLNIRRLADAPKSGALAPDGNYFAFDEGFFDIANWTSSFFTGIALHACHSTGDAHCLVQPNRPKAVYREK